MKVIIFAVIVNVIIFVANLVCMNCITKDVSKNVKRFVEFKCLANEFKKYGGIKSMRFGDFFRYFIFIIPIVNIITLFISCAGYDNMVKETQQTVIDEFISWVGAERRINNED